MLNNSKGSWSGLSADSLQTARLGQVRGLGTLPPWWHFVACALNHFLLENKGSQLSIAQFPLFWAKQWFLGTTCSSLRASSEGSIPFYHTPEASQAISYLELFLFLLLFFPLFLFSFFPLLFMSLPQSPKCWGYNCVPPTMSRSENLKFFYTVYY